MFGRCLKEGAKGVEGGVLRLFIASDFLVKGARVCVESRSDSGAVSGSGGTASRGGRRC
jgi:hypothetical protein